MSKIRIPEGRARVNAKIWTSSATMELTGASLSEERAMLIYLLTVGSDRLRPLVEVYKERERQRNEKGYDASHDDAHKAGELANAAACYAMKVDSFGLSSEIHSHLWPEGWDAPKPGDTRRQELIKACALLLAEMERLDRAEEQG